jgi:hypothetical protein
MLGLGGRPANGRGVTHDAPEVRALNHFDGHDAYSSRDIRGYYMIYRSYSPKSCIISARSLPMALMPMMPSLSSVLTFGPRLRTAGPTAMSLLETGYELL